MTYFYLIPYYHKLFDNIDKHCNLGNHTLTLSRIIVLYLLTDNWYVFVGFYAINPVQFTCNQALIVTRSMYSNQHDVITCSKVRVLRKSR